MHPCAQQRHMDPSLTTLQDTLLLPLQIATSPLLLRTYLRTILLLITSSILFGAAVFAYISFYYAYIPVRGIELPVYLQYEHALDISLPPATDGQIDVRMPKHPYGIARIEGLVSRQKYDVAVAVTMPRSRRNLEAGNWMVGVEFRGSETKGGGRAGLDWDDWDSIKTIGTGSTGDAISKEEVERGREKTEVLARSRRPAILTYRSWMTEMVYRGLRLPLYVLGFGSEAETVRVQLMEGVQFEKGWRNVPSTLRLELRSKIPLEVYRVSISFTARLEGLRWAMSTHRFASATVFIGIFWGVEMSLVLFTWALFSFCLSRPSDVETHPTRSKLETQHATPKLEDGESVPHTPFSDTDRTFPTLSSQKPLHYSSTSPKEERVTPALEDVLVKEEEADDEEDDFVLEDSLPSVAAGGMTDSGLGTSMERGVERRGLSRRKSQKDR